MPKVTVTLTIWPGFAPVTMIVGPPSSAPGVAAEGVSVGPELGDPDGVVLGEPEGVVLGVPEGVVLGAPDGVVLEPAAVPGRRSAVWGARSTGPFRPSESNRVPS